MSKIGGDYNRGKTYKHLPLRRISYVIRLSRSIFDRDYVMLECGHTAFASGIYRARCKECPQLSSPE